MVPEFRGIARQRQHMPMPQSGQSHQFALQADQIFVPAGQMNDARRAKPFPQQSCRRGVGHPQNCQGVIRQRQRRGTGLDQLIGRLKERPHVQAAGTVEFHHGNPLFFQPIQNRLFFFSFLSARRDLNGLTFGFHRPPCAQVWLKLIHPALQGTDMRRTDPRSTPKEGHSQRGKFHHPVRKIVWMVGVKITALGKLRLAGIGIGRQEFPRSGRDPFYQTRARTRAKGWS